MWFSFLDSDAGASHQIHQVSDITREVLDDFIRWLKTRPARSKTGQLSYATVRSLYGGLRSVLMQCVTTGQFRMDSFPLRPFPDIARSYNAHRPYTNDEMQSLMKALACDLRAIRDGTFSGNDCDRLAIYFLLIAVRTGRNPTSLYEMKRDAIQPHPLKPDTHSLLTTYKRRGNNISTQSIRKTLLVENVSVLDADVSGLIRDVLAFTSDLLDEAPSEWRNSLWLYRRQHRKDLGTIGLLALHQFDYCAQKFVARNHLIACDGSPSAESDAPLKIVLMRLRKTFASRMWELTGGDVVATANLLGNQPNVTDTHYLAVTPEMLRNHHFLGKCLEVELRGTSDNAATLSGLAAEMRIEVSEVTKILKGVNNTGVGRCSSPLHGRYAPKDGHTTCSAFLHCFRCPNQVVMGSDLYRLFSFYWLLVKERNLIGRNQWNKVYGWVIREIDNIIAPQFSQREIKAAKEKAYADPHPMWRDRSMLLESKNA